jgi:hypothetical protein
MNFHVILPANFNVHVCTFWHHYSLYSNKARIVDHTKQLTVPARPRVTSCTLETNRVGGEE